MTQFLGRYTVKPKGFQGWSFTPAQKIVECGSKECNAGQDLIFEVNGFSINGKIQVMKTDGCDEKQQQALNTISLKLKTEGTPQQEFTASTTFYL